MSWLKQNAPYNWDKSNNDDIAESISFNLKVDDV